MPFPKTSSIEMPILQELVATGGGDNLRFLYKRLVAYFPSISEQEITEIKNQKNKNWRITVQKAGKVLEQKNFIKRERGFWNLTEKGKAEVEAETKGFVVAETINNQPTHSDVQEMLVEIGRNLGFHTALEFEYYDVIWRETPLNQRISHIFEVQSKGNLDSAFAKLKRAYQNQRTKPFLILSTEKDFNRAQKSLAREFQDIENTVTILTFEQIKQVHQNLANIGEIIKEFLLK